MALSHPLLLLLSRGTFEILVVHRSIASWRQSDVAPVLKCRATNSLPSITFPEVDSLPAACSTPSRVNVDIDETLLPRKQFLLPHITSFTLRESKAILLSIKSRLPILVIDFGGLSSAPGKKTPLSMKYAYVVSLARNGKNRYKNWSGFVCCTCSKVITYMWVYNKSGRSIGLQLIEPKCIFLRYDTFVFMT